MRRSSGSVGTLVIVAVLTLAGFAGARADGEPVLDQRADPGRLAAAGRLDRVDAERAGTQISNASCCGEG